MSETGFLGADVLFHFLTRQNPEYAERCRALLTQAANGQMTLEVTSLTFVELVETLESHYSRQTIASRLPALLRIPGLFVHDREILLRALELYARHPLSFRNACQLAYVATSPSRTIYTHSEDFDREGVQRREP